MNSASGGHAFLQPRIRLSGVGEVMMILCFCGTLAGWFGPWFWLFDLFDHFRLQAAGMSLGVATWMGLCRRRWLASFAMTMMLANAVPLWQTTWVSAPPSSDTDLPGDVKICCFNVLTGNARKADVVSYLRAEAPDAIVLLEVDGAWVEALQPLHAFYPHQIMHPRDDNFGMALLSRWPLTNPGVLSLGDLQLPAVTATVHPGTRPFLLVGAHLIPPTRSHSALDNLAEAEDLAEFLARHRDLPVVVAGDFNASPWSRTVRIVRERGSVDFRQPGPAWRPSWNTRSVLMLPLDHAFCSAPLVITERTIGPDLGSDHRPQMLLLR